MQLRDSRRFERTLTKEKACASRAFSFVSFQTPALVRNSVGLSLTILPDMRTPVRKFKSVGLSLKIQPQKPQMWPICKAPDDEAWPKPCEDSGNAADGPHLRFLLAEFGSEGVVLGGEVVVDEA